MTSDLRPAEAVTLASDALERIRKRQYEVSYYGALVAGALFMVAHTFAEEKLDSQRFYAAVILLAGANGLFCFLFQCGLLFALGRCRDDLAAARQTLDPAYRPFRLHVLRDLPLFLYLAMLPAGAAGFLVWLCLGKGGAGVLSFVALLGAR